MKLITETVDNVKYITEASENGKKNLYIEGTFLVGDTVNRNNRMYEMRTLRNEVKKAEEARAKAAEAEAKAKEAEQRAIDAEAKAKAFDDHVISLIRKEMGK